MENIERILRKRTDNKYLDQWYDETIELINGYKKLKTRDKRFEAIYDFLDEWIKTNTHIRTSKKEHRNQILKLDKNYEYLSHKKINLIVQEWAAYRCRTYLHLHNGKEREFLIY